MIKTGEEVLADIDATLEQLIQNAAAIHEINLNSLFASEMEALQKTQESLLARLVHMNDLLEPNQKQQQYKKKPAAFQTIEQKIVKFGQLNAQIMEQVSRDLKAAKKPDPNRPRIRNNRKRIKVPKS